MPRKWCQHPDLPQGYSTCLPDRFWKHVDKNGSIPNHMPHLGQCWEWTGYKQKGYGAISPGGICGKRVAASRVSWLINVGPITAEKPHILHKCDNRGCVRPDHLFAGTPKENSADAHAKGRVPHDNPPRGEHNYWAKLTESDVKFIRVMTNGFGADFMAQRFHVTREAIYAILKRKSWKHI